MCKMFITIRRDILPLPHAAVQGAHSCAEFMHFYGNLPSTLDWMNNHKTMILLSATESQIQQLKELYDNLGLKYRTFKEPDIGDIETATTFEPVSNDIGKRIFGHLSLLR